jgi:hypothetical protein
VAADFRIKAIQMAVPVKGTAAKARRKRYVGAVREPPNESKDAKSPRGGPLARGLYKGKAVKIASAVRRPAVKG